MVHVTLRNIRKKSFLSSTTTENRMKDKCFMFNIDIELCNVFEGIVIQFFKNSVIQLISSSKIYYFYDNNLNII